MDVIVIGAMKAATSTVCAFLEDHPDVFMVPNCEPNYFSHDSNFSKGPDWYANFVQGRTTEGLTGEGSNDYAARDLYPETAARMKAHNPHARIIYMVRHPLKRISSAWVQNRTDAGDAVPPTLDRAVQELSDLFLGQSRYWHNLEPFRAAFPDSQIFVGFMEDLQRDPDAFFADLCGFLDIAPRNKVERGHLNKSSGKRMPNRAYTVMKSVPLIETIKSVFPQTMIQGVKDAILTKKVDVPPEFSAAVKADLIKVLEPDAKALLAHCGKASDFWRLD